MSKTPWGDRAQVVAAVAAAIALGFTAIQFRDAGPVQKDDLEASMQQHMTDLDRYFAERPMLRRYFYDTTRRTVQTYPTEPRRANAEVLATAEMIIDQAATVAAASEHMDDAATGRWHDIFNSYYCESQAVRFVWASYGKSYSNTTKKTILGAAEPDLKKPWKRPEDVGCNLDPAR